MSESLIHLWPGASFHEDGYIVGNRNGLKELRDRIDAVLKSKSHDTMETMTGDGEGYSLHVILSEEKIPLAIPYTEDYAKENRETAIYPWNML